MRWIFWLLTGLVLVLAILVVTLVLLAAKLNPWLARRAAGSAIAATLLLVVWDVASLAFGPRAD